MDELVGWLATASFAVLALYTTRDWLRQRDLGRGYVALACACLAAVAGLNPVTAGPVVDVLTAILFLGVGYALLLFRNHLIPLPPIGRRLAVISVPLALAAAATSALAPSNGSGLETLAAVAYVAIWVVCVGEPIVRFWRAARTRPAVQRARMRALSAGYAGIIGVLAFEFIASADPLSPLGQVATGLATIVVVPALAAAFVPPAWLRRIWSSREKDAAIDAAQELLVSPPELAPLATRGLEWAIRLVGADGGTLRDASGAVLACQGRAGRPGTTIEVPLADVGSLELVAGPFTPVFGADESARLEQFAIGLVAALNRQRLAEELEGNAKLVEALNHQLEQRVLDRTRELGRITRRTATILRNIADAVVTADPRGVVTSGNRAADALFGLDAHTIRRGVTLAELFPAEYADDVRLDIESVCADCGRSADSSKAFTEATGRRQDGTKFAMEFRLDCVSTDDSPLLILCARDISERKEYIAQLEYQALHDALTGLPNRALFADRVEHAVLSSERSGDVSAVLLLDLDRFKDINDTFGHSVGDSVLQEVAARFQRCVRSTETIARLGGDEFGVLLTSMRRGAATTTARRLERSLRDPFVVGGRRIHVGVSIGIAVCPQHAVTADALVRHADTAMYVAKRRHSGVARYAPNADGATPLRLTVQGDFAAAMERGELVLHFQPIVDIRSGELSGVEALVRWQHPELGLLLPDRFIPALEESGQIDDLTLWVVRASVRAIHECDELGSNVVVAVNVSPRSLNDSRLPQVIGAELDAAGVTPCQLRLEVTEVAAMTEVDERVLAGLRDLGVALAIDDFGTGHSSLVRLRELPVREIKVDRSFVSGLGVRPEDEAIVRSTIDLAHGLGMRAVAEGVETADVLKRLAELGCDQAQGYFIARPMPLGDLRDWSQSDGATLKTQRVGVAGAA